ncbi:MAG: hypothetical protein KC897_12875 [Candidatus Omnitrophica bacterium]|nr:hypothetical protein [Candidatus Omnitrophota bacterium]MCB9722280.1 hypothetical protein [Candidatus Omnitrophota bacterium]
MTIVCNEHVILYEPDYIIKGIPAEFDDKEGDFFVNGMTCSRSSDTCTAYSQSPLLHYEYPVINSWLIVRTKPSLHVKLFINSPQANAREQRPISAEPNDN